MTVRHKSSGVETNRSLAAQSFERKVGDRNRIVYLMLSFLPCFFSVPI